ncbi:c-type cytochrome [Zeimonas arvi]|uniref:C-type cytochrome n=1 Tax=Zeimonas arvi TaxID=2498847 RepID=A0A5C8P687_9BURK|nr:c-type cytochrome [Zeimonas arvi]TXL68564.1 c-type cytochrome [Zeimonas arvi]
MPEFPPRSRAGRWARGLLAGVAVTAFAGAALAEKPVFTHPFDGAPIDTPLEAGEKSTPALEKFKETGENPYRGQPDALAAGKKLYDEWCQVCHAADATGKMGPSLVGNKHVYAQTATDAGMFAVVYAGASGAMQPFGGRIPQDDILKIIAYVRSLDKQAAAR